MEKEVKEVILQLIEQNEEQKNTLSSAIESHKTIVRKLQGDIAKLRKQSSKKFKISFPNSDRRRVKRFVPTDNSNVKKFDGLSAFTAMLPDSPSSDYDLYKAESDAQNRWDQYYGKPVMDQVKDAEAALNAHVLERQRPVRYDNTGFAN